MAKFNKGQSVLCCTPAKGREPAKHERGVVLAVLEKGESAEYLVKLSNRNEWVAEWRLGSLASYTQAVPIYAAPSEPEPEQNGPGDVGDYAASTETKPVARKTQRKRKQVAP